LTLREAQKGVSVQRWRGLLLVLVPGQWATRATVAARKGILEARGALFFPSVSSVIRDHLCLGRLLVTCWSCLVRGKMCLFNVLNSYFVFFINVTLQWFN
jgi:hypothetical protein